jgi:hypothetical protein
MRENGAALNPKGNYVSTNVRISLKKEKDSLTAKDSASFLLKVLKSKLNWKKKKSLFFQF